MLWLFAAGAQPAAAEGICKDDNPYITAFTLSTNSGYQLQFKLMLKGDKISGGLFVNPAHPGETAIHGSVDGQLFPPDRMFIQVFLYPPAPPGTKILIWGSLSEGGGRGELKQTDWGVDVPHHTWTARTVTGCPKWPEDVVRHELAKAAEAEAEAAIPAAAAANPLYACDASSWSSTTSGTLGYEFVSDCARNIAGTVPGGDNQSATRPASIGPGRGSMAWQACEAALKKRVDAMIEAMRPTCDKATRLQEAKNRCIPAHRTPDGKIYQNVPSPFTDEGKDVQLCMNHVQRCFDRNAEAAAQDACANQIVQCFDTGNDAPVRSAAARLPRAGGLNSSGSTNGRVRGAIPICLSTGHSADAVSAFKPHGKIWSSLVSRSASGLALGSTYADVASPALACPPKVTAISAIRTERPFVSLAFAGAPSSGVTAKGTRRLVALHSGAGCLPDTPPTATLPVVRLPADGKASPKVTNRGASSQSSSGASLAAPGKDKLKTKVSTGSSGSYPVRAGGKSAMDRLSGAGAANAINAVSGSAAGPQGGRRQPSAPAARATGTGVSSGGGTIDYGGSASRDSFRAPR